MKWKCININILQDSPTVNVGFQLTGVSGVTGNATLQVPVDKNDYKVGQYYSGFEPILATA